MPAFLVDSRVVFLSVLQAAYNVGLWVAPLWPGWLVAKELFKKGGNPFPIAVAAGALSAALASVVAGSVSTYHGLQDPAPDVRGFAPAAMLLYLVAGVVVMWPFYSLCLWGALRRKAFVRMRKAVAVPPEAT
ncbi:MAG: hypothetical protein FD126_463 [Elusimicrobia bacterium]|nr:MAG: hypothetical protein FD126_463 [Elusimicrobiota bacterium]